MNFQKTFLSIILVTTSILVVEAQNNPKKSGVEAITEQVVKAQLDFLASDLLEGRKAEERGGFLAADYIASIFATYGIQPGGDFVAPRYPHARPESGERAPAKVRSYFQDFNVIKSVPGDEQTLEVISENGLYKVNYGYRTNYLVSAGESDKEFTAPVVFVGYGITDEKNGYDELKGIDLKGKIVLRISGFPGHNDKSSAAYIRFSANRQEQVRGSNNDKDKTIIEGGAIAILNIVNPELGSWATNFPIVKSENSRPESDRLIIPGSDQKGTIVNISVTQQVVAELLRNTRVDIDEFESTVAKTLKPASQLIAGKTIHLKTTTKTELVKIRNVIGVLEGDDKDHGIVIGAHYDHLGISNGVIWNGSDDNASGTVGVLTIAKAFAASGEKPKKTVVFAAWTAEERGLLGSKYYVEHPYFPIENTILNINFDLISRNGENDANKNQVEAFVWNEVSNLTENTKKNNQEYGLGLDVNYVIPKVKSGASDFLSFINKDRPFYAWRTPLIADYHQPSDESWKADIGKATRIIKLGFLDAWDFVNQ